MLGGFLVTMAWHVLRFNLSFDISSATILSEPTLCRLIAFHVPNLMLVIGFIDHLQIVTTSNYSAVANSHTRQFTVAHTKFSQFVLTSCFLVMDPNNVLCLCLY
jgi:hypothetical protein